MNSNLTRKIQGFNPVDLLEIGEGVSTVGPSGETIPGEPVYYLPAKARQDWFNQYCFENNKVMPLTTSIENSQGGMIIVKATLQEVIKLNDQETLVTIATGIASQFIEASSTSAIVEICETRAKARCLGAAGFCLPKEYSIFDEGEVPVDGSLMNRRTAQKGVSTENDEFTSEEKKEPQKRKRGRPRKVKSEQDVVTNDVENSSSQDVPEIPSFEKISNLVPNNGPEEKSSKKDDTMEEKETLKKCLRAFFPYGQYKGQQVVDVITQKKFKDTIDKMSMTNYDNQMVNDDLSVNTLIQTLKKYLNLPSSEERLLLMNLVSELRQEDEGEDY